MFRRHWFHFVSYSVLALFLGIMLYVIAIAYLRISGSTGLDMATMQKMRYDSIPQKTPLSSPPLIP